ncbi:auxin efflux carrier [Dipodascopsis uninucleata]
MESSFFADRLSLDSSPDGSSVSVAKDHDHPSYSHLAFLTFQAVIQVVMICVLGFFAAKVKLLNPSLQKHISQLNVQVFTPCLIFVKLGSAITVDKLASLSIIPVLFVITTGVSFTCGYVVSKIQRFNRRESNFVIAMAVFGNSNSLPVSLTIALAQTLPALKWLDTDNSSTIASRGILYLLIFQQLGQMLRWSWGYNTLLSRKPADEANCLGRDDNTIESIPLSTKALFPHDYAHSLRSSDSSVDPPRSITGSRISSSSFNRGFNSSRRDISDIYRPRPPLFRLRQLASEPPFSYVAPVLMKVNSFMNPPLYAMFAGLLVATISPIQNAIFHSSDGFLYNTLTTALTETSEVSVPLTLVVLGANLYPDDEASAPSRNSSRLVYSSLIARMLLPAIILLPIITLFAKTIHLSILDDPIFIVVLFLLTTSPPAIQLSQICQLNEVFEREMASILFWGYVVLTLPITMVMIVMSLEVLEWSGRLIPQPPFVG